MKDGLDLPELPQADHVFQLLSRHTEEGKITPEDANTIRVDLEENARKLVAAVAQVLGITRKDLEDFQRDNMQIDEPISQEDYCSFFIEQCEGRRVVQLALVGEDGELLTTTTSAPDTTTEAGA